MIYWLKLIGYAVGAYCIILFGVVNTCPNWSAKKCFIAAAVVLVSPILYLIVYWMLGLG